MQVPEFHLNHTESISTLFVDTDLVSHCKAQFSRHLQLQTKDSTRLEAYPILPSNMSLKPWTWQPTWIYSIVHMQSKNLKSDLQVADKREIITFQNVN